MEENYRVRVSQLPRCLRNISDVTFLMRINVAPCVEEVIGV